MGEVYRLYTESDYDATMKNTGSGQTQGWDATSRLGGGGEGDVKIVITGTPIVYFFYTITAIGSNALRFRFYYDFSAFTFQSGTVTEVFVVYSSAVNYLTRAYVKRVGSQYYFRVGQYNDGRTLSSFTDFAISSTGPDYLECYYVRPTSDMSGNGTVSYTTGVDGLIGTHTGIDNYDEFPLIQEVRFGAGLLSGSIPVGNTGNLFFGKILIRNDANPIGPFLSYRHRPRPAAIMKKRQRIKGHRCG